MKTPAFAFAFTRAHAFVLSDRRADASAFETASGRQANGSMLPLSLRLCALAGAILRGAQ